jgi:hypothetical protein
MRAATVLILIALAVWMATHRNSNCDAAEGGIQKSGCEKSNYPAKGALAPSLESAQR